jgi:hypothetical protein
VFAVVTIKIIAAGEAATPPPPASPQETSSVSIFRLSDLGTILAGGGFNSGRCEFLGVNSSAEAASSVKRQYLQESVEQTWNF